MAVPHLHSPSNRYMVVPGLVHGSLVVHWRYWRYLRVFFPFFFFLLGPHIQIPSSDASTSHQKVKGVVAFHKFFQHLRWKSQSH